MAFGQNRQEDVIAYLQKKCPPERLEQIAGELKVDLSPPRHQADSAAVGPVRRFVARKPSVDTELEYDQPLSHVPLDVHRARELLDAFRTRALRSLPSEVRVERYSELLDQFARLRYQAT
jgi:hypothetical protein